MVYKPTRRLLLRTPRLSDAPSYFALVLNPPNFVYEPVQPSVTPTVKGYEAFIQAIIDATQRREEARVVIVVPTDPTAPLLDKNNKPIQHPVIGLGGINSLFIKNGMKYADVAVMIDSAETRKGYGTEALTAIIDMAFGEYGVEIVQLETMAANIPFDSFMKRNFVEFLGVEKDGPWGREKNYEIWRAEWELRAAKKASK